MINKDEIQIRHAENRDIPFLITTIIEADKSGTGKSAYCSLLNMTELELGEMIENIFKHELEGFEFAVDSFCVLEYRERVIGASAGWIEEFDGIPSWQTRMLSIRAEAKPESYNSLIAKKDIVSNLIPLRTPNTLQIESVYIREDFRGLGLFHTMLDFHIKTGKVKMPSLTAAEIIVYDNNKIALNSYQKSGFLIERSTKLENNELQNVFPSNGMILLSKNI
jgi:ribosomal protein S18 acetylase RimI-like enzyme